MREGGYSLGGEQTGHTIFGDIERTGDGIMTSLRVMEVIRAERETLSQLTAPCKLLPQAQVAVRVADKDAALENMGVQNAIAEAEAALAGEGRVLDARAEPSRLSACWPRRPTKHPPMPP